MIDILILFLRIIILMFVDETVLFVESADELKALYY